jgi:predicted nucleic acid-binding protein
MPRARVIIDTNVLVSALLNPGGTACKSVRRAFDRCVVLYSLIQRIELGNAMSDRELLFEVRELEDSIVEAAEYSEFPSFPASTGNYIVDFADAADADFVITGDLETLVFASGRAKPRIVEPADFLRETKFA